MSMSDIYGIYIASGVKCGDDYKGPLRSKPTGWGQPKKTLRTVDGPLLHVIMTTYNFHMFFSLVNLNIQKILKHSNTRLGKAQLSTRAPCSVRTQRVSQRARPNRALLRVIQQLNEQIQNRSLKMQTEKYVKEPNSAPARGVLCAQRAHEERRVSKRINTALDWITL